MNFQQCPRTSEEREPLSANRGVASGRSGGLLVDTNLDTSNPDTYTPPPAPTPYDVDLRRPRTSDLTKSDTVVEITNTGFEKGLNNVDSQESCKTDLKKVDSETHSELELTPSENPEDDLKKLVESNLTIQEEDCPICLEGDNLIKLFHFLLSPTSRNAVKLCSISRNVEGKQIVKKW